MQKFYTVVLLFLIPIAANADSNTQIDMVAEGVSTANVEQSLQSLRTAELQEMLAKPEFRLDYVRSIYTNQRLEQSIIENELNQNPALLVSLRNARRTVLLDALIDFEFKKIDDDLEALALERYQTNPSAYASRKRIKMAFIFVKKEAGIEDQARVEIEGILAQLNAQPDNDTLFYELAEEHSDDPLAVQGGVVKKWLIAPVDLTKKSPILQAAFELERAGQLSEVIEIEQGFSIAKLMKIQPERRLSFAETKSEIIAYIMSDLKNRKKAQVMATLKPDDDLTINDETVMEMISAEYATRTSKTPGH